MVDQSVAGVQSLGVQFDAVPGPDGSQWARLTFTNGPTAFVLAIPADLMGQLIAGFAKEWAGLEAQIKEANSPIKRATPADLKRMNGHAARR